MSDEPKTLTLTFDEFEATAKRITHQWMYHMGYMQHAIDGAEQLVDDDSPIDIDDPAADAIRDLLDSSELVVFVMERLAGLPEAGAPVVARDEAAELRARIGELETTNFALSEDSALVANENAELRAALDGAHDAMVAALTYHHHSLGNPVKEELNAAVNRAGRALAGGENEK